MFEIRHRGFSAAARPLLRWLAVAAVCALAGCVYDVPITASGTRNIDAKLLGDWRSKDGKEQLKIRELNGTTYLLLLNGDPFRAYHSDFAGVPFVSVQDLDKPEHFRLVKMGKHCALVHERTGKRTTLASTTCLPK